MALQQINTDILQELVVHEPLVVAGKKFGDHGSGRMKDILRFLKRCAATTRVTERTNLMVFALVNTDSSIDQARLANAVAFQFNVLPGEISSLMIEIRADGTPYTWQQIPPDIMAVARQGIIYRLLQSVETFEIDGISLAVPKVIESSISQYFVHGFTTLKEALCAYRDNMARTSTCYLLREAWHDQNNRFWFRAGPEFILRRALCNYLRAYLRHDDMELRPEQNVDESHPVDIKIIWRANNRDAIIEVKWLGKSRDLQTGGVTATYTDARARSGARQLAKYLESHRQEAPAADTRGYLVVFDCRRKGLTLTTTTLSRDAGMHYANREVKYAPTYHENRADFEEPIRMFLEPVCV